MDGRADLADHAADPVADRLAELAAVETRIVSAAGAFSAIVADHGEVANVKLHADPCADWGRRARLGDDVWEEPILAQLEGILA